MIKGDKFLIRFGDANVAIPDSLQNIDTFFIQITPYILSHIESDESDNFYILKPEKFEDSFFRVFNKEYLIIKDINNLKKYYNEELK